MKKLILTQLLSGAIGLEKVEKLTKLSQMKYFAANTEMLSLSYR